MTLIAEREIICKRIPRFCPGLSELLSVLLQETLIAAASRVQQ